MLIVLCILFSILIFFVYLNYKKDREIQEINQDIIEKNKIIKEEYDNAIYEKEEIQKEIVLEKNKLNEVKRLVEDLQNTSKTSFENYCDILDKNYQQKENEYNYLINKLENCYDKKQDELAETLANTQQDLDKISSTRAAAIQAQIKEQEIKEQSNFYSLSIDEIDQREVRILQSIESELRDSRPIRMII
jgi:hypothetical protein